MKSIVLMATEDRPAPPTCDCPPGRCRFRVPLTRAYLHAAQDARRYREPLADVLQDNLKASRDADPFIQRGRIEQGAARDIALSLERARDEGGIALVPQNAERVAAFCCPRRFDEEPSR
jgi:hypothetical protein